MEPTLVSAFSVIGSARLHIEVDDQATIRLFNFLIRMLSEPHNIRKEIVCPVCPPFKVATEPDDGIFSVRKLQGSDEM